MSNTRGPWIESSRAATDLLMPDSCCRPDYDRAFDAKSAREQALAYRHDGATGTTRRLLDAIEAAGDVAGATVLDIGGGIGIIGLELLAAGAASAVEVDASAPYVSVARHEASRRGLGDRATIRHGDFVELADSIGTADIVTLHRVICCYEDWRSLVDRSTERARRLFGVVYPLDRWWVRTAIGLGNLTMRLIRRPFRGFVHPERAIDARIREAGFERRFYQRGWAWQTILYERRANQVGHTTKEAPVPAS
jgi:SAM-dependent methyltransferase